MPVQMNYEPNDICVLRISGILKRSEFGTEERAFSSRIDTLSKPRLLVILENFEGWERGAERVSVNTCELDGPAALPNYCKRGFEVVNERLELRELRAS